MFNIFSFLGLKYGTKLPVTSLPELSVYRDKNDWGLHHDRQVQHKEFGIARKLTRKAKLKWLSLNKANS